MDDDSEIRERILSIFSVNRMKPDAPFEEKSFLRFLFDPPLDFNKARNSFRTLRRLNAFMHGVEESFGVAFTNDEWEKNWNLPALTQAIGKKLSNPGAQLKFIEKRCHQSKRDILGLPFVATLVILLPLVCLMYKLGLPLWAALMVAAVPLGFLIRFGISHHLHYRAVKRTLHSKFPDR